VTVPAENIDKTKPADVGRIEVYGYTGTAQPPRGRFLDVATLVATVAVRPPVVESTEKQPSTTLAVPPAADSPRTTGAATDRALEAAQGEMVTVRDHLSADALIARPIPPLASSSSSRRAPVLPAAPTTAKESAVRRFYISIAFSRRGRPGPPGMVAELPLHPIPDPPLGVVATLAADAISVSWEPSGGVVGSILERTLPIESSPIDEAAVPESGPRPAAADPPSGPTLYNVYRELEAMPAVSGAPVPPADEPIAAPINTAPLTVLTYSEPVPLLDGRKRCYTVRAVRGAGPSAIEGESSPPSCVTPTDDFPPAAPVGLSATVEPGEIRLSWEPNTEADLAGYVVLRGEAGDATLTPLTGSVIADPRFVDQTVRPGVRYTYAVAAVDTHLPTPNVSAASSRIEEAAR
jgi:hypothetical protein